MFASYRGISKDAKYLIMQSVLPSVAYGLFFTDISYYLTTVKGLPYAFMGLVISVIGITTFLGNGGNSIALSKVYFLLSLG
jgi:hypothetical protein